MTIQGTAVGGVAYQPMSGALTWPPHDSRVQSVDVPLLPSAVHGVSYFTFQLASVVNASLDDISNTTIIIAGMFQCRSDKRAEIDDALLPALSLNLLPTIVYSTERTPSATEAVTLLLRVPASSLEPGTVPGKLR